MVWQPGEEGRLLAVSGGITNERIDPDWKNNVTQELAMWLERELMPNFGLRTGVIWRGDTHKQVTLNPNRPMEAYNVPVTVRDPGPDGRIERRTTGGRSRRSISIRRRWPCRSST